MPESDKPTLKAQLASEVAHIRQARSDIAVADGTPDNWTFLESLPPEAQAVDFWHACEHLRTASDHAVDPRWFETCRHILRHDPCGVAKVIRALRYLRDKAGSNRAARNAVERELAFFRKHRKRMRYRHLSDRGVAIGSGVVEAANKILITQRRPTMFRTRTASIIWPSLQPCDGLPDRRGSPERTRLAASNSNTRTRPPRAVEAAPPRSTVTLIAER